MAPVKKKASPSKGIISRLDELETHVRELQSFANGQAKYMMAAAIVQGPEAAVDPQNPGCSDSYLPGFYDLPLPARDYIRDLQRKLRQALYTAKRDAENAVTLRMNNLVTRNGQMRETLDVLRRILDVPRGASIIVTAEAVTKRAAEDRETLRRIRACDTAGDGR